ncbi:hypothetical protein AB0O76_32670 [Streptomyces sp. NPDC086554]|uniref:hypothetical protein n=1 Tax=Streptomyces sp. NPDC086554 TaxID=3154864 RepID=UPI00343BA82A
MHTYDPTRHRPAYQNPIPSMRSSQDTGGTRSATPIYDALYSEYRRSFKALPGDRSGEEDLGFTAFGAMPYGMHRAGDRQSPRHNTLSQLHVTRYGQEQHGTGHQQFPAALPPGPRRGN